MTAQAGPTGIWTKLPVSLRAIVTGLIVGMIPANVWPLFLLTIGVPLAAISEAAFLVLYVWWASGGGPPRGAHAVRVMAFRRGSLSPAQWRWGLLAAVFFAATVHASIVVLFRLVPFPMAAFREGYNFSFITTRPLQWIAVVMSAISAGVCEETGFRGYMQVPIEQRHGTRFAILISSFLFMALHLTKGWATIGMVPIVFGAGVLLGLLAWSCESLIPCMIGHTIMDIGLFGYWWTGVAGDFTARPIFETGVDQLFVIACAVLAVSLAIVLFSIGKLRRIEPSNRPVDRAGSASNRNDYR